MNCRGVNGEPLVEGDDLTDCGLLLVGVERAKVGTKGNLGSGVRGGNGGEVTSAASSNDAEFIHFSSPAPGRGGDSGMSRKLSAQ